MKNVCCIILGGGKGTRLFPLTRDRSKPAVPIGGKYRLIDIPMSNSINSGIKKIFILTQFNSVSLNRHIYSTYIFDMFSGHKVHLLAAEQTLDSMNWFQGTADAVRRHIMHYHWKPTDDVLILSGDHLYRMDFHEIIQFHREHNADLTLTTLLIPGRIAHEFGILKLDRHHRITGFVEKPKKPEQLKDFAPEKEYLTEGKTERYFASMGIYVFKAAVLEELLKGDEADFGKELIPKAIRTHKSFGFVFSGYWRDVGTIKSFYEANLELTSKNPRFSFFQEEAPIFTHPRFLMPSKIMNSKVENSLVAEGSVVMNAEIENSIIGLRTIICRDVKIRRSILMGVDADFSLGGRNPKMEPCISDGCVIENAILDKNVKLGRNVKITNHKKLEEFDGENYCIREGIVVIPKNTVIPDGTII